MAEPARLSVRNARLSYHSADGPVAAIDGVSFELAAGETLGVVGESGCGKSSLARLITGLADRAALVSGEVRLDGQRIDGLGPAAWRPIRRRLQYVFQDPLGALDPRMSILAQVREPLDIHNAGPRRARTETAARLLQAVGIGAHLHRSAAVEISGGQRQRVVLARALILKPDLLLCDEPVSALDVSIQAQILALLDRLRDELGLTTLFISHDLAVVRHISQRVAVMYLGRFVEVGPVDAVLARPAHPYTRALIDAVPGRGRGRTRFRLTGETPKPAARPQGCALAGRCPSAAARCRAEDPSLAAHPSDPARTVACHFPETAKVAA
ncbi:MAG: ABC transporter ATP-binding protein [Pikeienuella sp.]